MTMLTRWGEDLDPDEVLPEYPRPQLVRGGYLNLNGRWEYAFGRDELDFHLSLKGEDFHGSRRRPFCFVTDRGTTTRRGWARRSCGCTRGRSPRRSRAG